MATKKKCPNCQTMTPHQKKGKSTTGKQRWRCNDCKKQWTEGSASPAKKPSTKKAAPKRAASVTGKKDVTTVIKVNGNEIKKKKGQISNDDAFDLISDYFREITKTNVDRKEDSAGNVTINFQVKTGKKG